MNRREFILSGSAAAGLAVSGLAAAETPRAKIKIGFLGGAHSHGVEKWKTIDAQSAYELVGICEESAAVREAFGKLGAKVVTRDELFARSEVVVVESAVRDHARDARLALVAGKHVHVEKPPAATLREFEELLELARTQQRLLQVGYMWRFNPGFVRAFEAARQGWLGEVYLVRATMNSFIDAKRRPEWGEFKGGAMFELGCHLIDAVVRLLGKPVKVTPHLQRLGGDGLADNCVAVFEFPKAQAIVTSSVLHPNAGPQRFLEILGTNGVARVQPIEQPALTLDLAKAAGPYRAGVQKIELPPYRRYADEFVELASCLREGKPLSTSPETERHVQETLLQACGML
jgi:predicted dehydrogenase